MVKGIDFEADRLTPNSSSTTYLGGNSRKHQKGKEVGNKTGKEKKLIKGITKLTNTEGNWSTVLLGNPGGVQTRA